MMVLDYVFPFFRIRKLVTRVLEISNSTNPILIAKNVTLTVVECCAPPQIRIMAQCIAAAATIAASVVSPNPFPIGSAIHLLNEIYDEC